MGACHSRSRSLPLLFRRVNNADKGQLSGGGREGPGHSGFTELRGHHDDHDIPSRMEIGWKRTKTLTWTKKLRRMHAWSKAREDKANKGDIATLKWKRPRM